MLQVANNSEESQVDGHDLVVRTKDDRFLVMIPALSIVAEDDSLQAAYESICQQKRKLYESARRWGVEEELDLPIRNPSWRGTFQGFCPFLAKFGIIVIVGSLALIVTTRAIVNELTAFPAEQLGRKVVRGGLVAVRRVVTGNSEAERDTNIAAIKEFVIMSKPIAEELWQLLPAAQNRE